MHFSSHDKMGHKEFKLKVLAAFEVISLYIYSLFAYCHSLGKFDHSLMFSVDFYRERKAWLPCS